MQKEAEIIDTLTFTQTRRRMNTAPARISNAATTITMMSITCKGCLLLSPAAQND